MNEKPKHLAVTKRRVRTFPLLSSRTLFSGIVQPRFLVLRTTARQRAFLAGVPQVFKKDRTPTGWLGKTVNQQQQIHQVEFNFSPTINLHYVTNPRTTQKSYFQSQQLLNKFTSHFTLLFSQLNDDVSVVKNSLTQYSDKRGVEHRQSELRSATVFRDNNETQRLLLVRSQAPFISDARQETLRLVTRQSKTISTSSHNWSTHLVRADPASTHLTVKLNRSVLFTKVVSARTSKHFKTLKFTSILNSSTITSRESQLRNQIHLPTNSFTSMAVQLVLPKFTETEHVERRIAQLLSRPEMTHVKPQQNSSENIVEVLRDLQKLRLQPQIPTTQVPSIEQLTNHVRTQLERELRIERERRGR